MAGDGDVRRAKSGFRQRGMAADNSDAPAPQSKGAPFSCSGSVKQFGRGMTNVALCWLELPYQIKTHLEDKSEDHPCDVFKSVFDLSPGG